MCLDMSVGCQGFMYMYVCACMNVCMCMNICVYVCAHECTCV